MHPPNDWAEVYAAVMEMRKNGTAQNAAVDTMGCERLALETVSPKVKSTYTNSRNAALDKISHSYPSKTNL